MERKFLLRLFVFALIIVLVALLTLGVAGVLNPVWFWLAAIVSAGFAFLVLPRLGRGL